MRVELREGVKSKKKENGILGLEPLGIFNLVKSLNVCYDIS